MRFSVNGLPIAQGSKRVIGKAVIESNQSRLKPWRQEVAQMALAEMDGDLTYSGPVSVTVMFFLPRPRGHYGTGRNADKLRDSAPAAPAVKPDIDKLARSVLDALTGIVFHDDSQVVTLTAHKVYAEYRNYPGATVEVRRVV